MTALRYIIGAFNVKDVDQFAEKIRGIFSTTIEENVMTIAEQIYQRGINRGMNRGMNKGMNKGLREGLSQGFDEGVLKCKQDVVRNLLMVDVSVEVIQAATELSQAEIKKIKQALPDKVEHE